jgi:2-oxoglutarate dehydrogenase E1 component
VAPFPAFAQMANVELIDEMHARYLENPEKVESSWRHFFEGVDFAGFLFHKRGEAVGDDRRLRVYEAVQAYRRYGHLMAAMDPLSLPLKEIPELSLQKLGFEPHELEEPFPSLHFCSTVEAPLKEILAALQRLYASRIGFQYMDLENPEMERWIQERIEPSLPIQLSLEEKRLLLEMLNKSEIFESFIHTKYVGQKRFSLEGAETLIPMIAELIEEGAARGMEEWVLGMAHRGRLNVLANLLGKPYSVIFQEFEDSFLPLQFEGSGDVKYHKGFSADAKLRSGKSIQLHLAPNSSALESVDPVVLGIARGTQVLRGDSERKKVGALLIHGDAALAGQGVVYESLQLMRLPGYSTGGTLHIAVNNQIGFTTLPEEGRSTRYCTDIARAFHCPVFHLNAEDPESCLYAAKLALELRLQFQCDVFLDLNCYRKYGHNEGDEPSFTQPLQYEAIRAKPPIRDLYLQQLQREGAAEQKLAAELEGSFRTLLQEALERAKGEIHPPKERFGVAWEDFVQPPVETLFDPFASKVTSLQIEQVVKGFCQIPEGFSLHPKLQKWLQDRRSMGEGKQPIDWAMAECLAFGTLLLEKIPIRLSGQDSRRGTFSQRHGVWVDQKKGTLYFPFSHLDPAAASCDIYNSPLSEFGCLGFEYGYNCANLHALVIWEAQYGDFTIGAQTVLDHYLTTGEHKWARYSSLTLLLPHGYEGQGPEHSSARIERFLQLAAVNNTQVVYPTTPAQYFHLLRRQALRKLKKPLIVFTPKSLLRAPFCTSSLDAFTHGQFQEILPDLSIASPKRLLLCSGKVYYDLLEHRKEKSVAIVRIEQLYPLQRQKLEALFKTAPPDIRWVQEEPQNMGPWEFLRGELQALLPKSVTLRYVGRQRSDVTATGSFQQHKQEWDRFMQEAFE